MRKWTREERLRQSQLIGQWKPWNNSTGAKTDKGKETSKMNAYKHGGFGAESKIIKQLINCYKRYPQ